MGKKLNDWLDEFVENGADPKAVQEWPNNVSGGGGIKLVNTLPEVGEVDALYKLPNGDIYSYDVRQIPVYKTPEVNDIVTIRKENFNWTDYLTNLQQGVLIVLTNSGEDLSQTLLWRLEFPIEEGASSINLYFNSPNVEIINRDNHVWWSGNDYNDNMSYHGEWDNEENVVPEPLQFKITQEFVDALTGNNLTLSDLAMLFECKIDHYEAQSSWTKLTDTIIEVHDIHSLTSEQCESLQIGDSVVQKNEFDDHSEKMLYIVTYKAVDYLSLVCSGRWISEIDYVKTDDEWLIDGNYEYDIDAINNIPSISGTYSNNYWTNLNINGVSKDIPSISGINDNSYWTSLNINGISKNIPSISANPSGTASQDLSKLNINGVNYNVGGSSTTVVTMSSTRITLTTSQMTALQNNPSSFEFEINGNRMRYSSKSNYYYYYSSFAKNENSVLRMDTVVVEKNSRTCSYIDYALIQIYQDYFSISSNQSLSSPNRYLKVAFNNFEYVHDESDDDFTIKSRNTTAKHSYSYILPKCPSTEISNKTKVIATLDNIESIKIPKVSDNLEQVYYKNPTTWKTTSWGFTIQGSQIWTDGDNIYYSNGTTQKVLDKLNIIWVNKTWTGLTNFSGQYIWKDEDNIYYSNGSVQYVLDKTTSTWSTKTWTGLTDFTGGKVWTDGENIYYSDGSTQKILDRSTSTWSNKNWTGISTNNFYGHYVWTDGENIYCSSYTHNYVLDKSTSTWSDKTWSGLTNFYGNYIWTDGTNIYYSNTTTQYVLDRTTSTWTAKTWTGLTNYDGFSIWSDGKTVYYSHYLYKDEQYVLKHDIEPYIDINSDKTLVPKAPITSGTYTLQVVVDSEGKPTYQWIANN